MTGTSSTYLLNIDEIRAAATGAGIQELPGVLSLRPTYTTVAERDFALAGATRSLESRGLITDGQVRADLAEMLCAAERPDRELAMRWVTPSGIARISLSCREVTGVLIRQVGAECTLSELGAVSTPQVAAAKLLAELPVAHPAGVEPVGGPLVEMSEALTGSLDMVELTGGIRAVGAPPRAAAAMGAALSMREAFAEIVYNELLHERGAIARSPAAVAVFYTKRGRIIAVPSISQAGQLWTTLKPGSEQVFRQAIDQLVELSDRGWGSQ